MAKNISVIVIDDDKDTVSVFKDYLILKGVDVVGFGYNGKDAVDLYRKLSPDIVFLDHRMPEYDGLFALSNIKKINPNANVVFITADDSIYESKQVQELSPAAIMSKPFKIDDIMKVVHQIIKTKLM